MFYKIISIITLAIIVVSTPAIADTLPPINAIPIDFRDDAWGPAEGMESYSLVDGGVEVTVDVVAPTSGAITHNNWSLEPNGLGINSPEVNLSQRLDISFAQPYLLDTLWLSLIADTNRGTETARISLFDAMDNIIGNPFDVAGNEPLIFGPDQNANSPWGLGVDIAAAGGYLQIPEVSRIQLEAVNTVSFSSFSVVGMEGVAVPEPMTLITMATGLGISAMARRRKKRS